MTIAAKPTQSRQLLGHAVPPLHARVVPGLRRAILTRRRFKPGERLMEERLVEAPGVSRIPVRGGDPRPGLGGSAPRCHPRCGVTA